MNKMKESHRRGGLLVLPALLAMLFLCFGACVLGQGTGSPWLWGPNLGAIGENYVAISWNTSRAVGVDLNYAKESFYDAAKTWEETLVFEPHEGVAEIWLRDLMPGTTYQYQVVVYEGDAVYPRPIGRFTTSSDQMRGFSFLVYGDTRSFVDRHKLVADTMARDEAGAALVINTGDLVESPTVDRFESFFGAIEALARSHPYSAVLGNHDRGHANYFEFLALPPGGGQAGEQWWSFDYGNVHFVGLDSSVLAKADGVMEMQQQTEWLASDLAGSDARFKVVCFHYPIYSSAWEEGVEESLRTLWEPIFLEHGVDVVFTGHTHCYEHFYVNGLHYVVTAGGGAPLQDPIDAVPDGLVFRRYGTLHYLRVTVADAMMRVEAIPVASVYDDEVYPVPTGRAIDSFIIEGTP